MDVAQLYRFVIVAEPGGQAQILEVSCLGDVEAIEAAQMFAEDAVSVAVWSGGVRLWQGPARN